MLHRTKRTSEVVTKGQWENFGIREMIVLRFDATGGVRKTKETFSTDVIWEIDRILIESFVSPPNCGLIIIIIIIRTLAC